MSLQIEIQDVIQDVIQDIVLVDVIGSFTQDNESYLMNIDDEMIELTDTLGQTKIKDDDIEDENLDKEFYCVDKLLDKRVNVKGKTEYLVKWEGDYDPTWEPENFINSILIRQFLLKKEIEVHNSQVKQSVGVQTNSIQIQPQSQPQGVNISISIPPVLPVAHLYLRVSDPSKTALLFSQSKQQLQAPSVSTNGLSSTTTTTQQPQQNYNSYQSYQSYFGDFPSGNFSLETQKDILFKHCKDNKFLVGSIEMDDGVSARDPTKLKGLQEIIKNIQKDETLLFLDLSRFSRNTTVGIQILDDLYKRGVKVFSVLDGMNYNTPAAQHCVRTTISTAQLESDIKSIKLKASFQNIKKNGGYLGSRAPYGFKVIRECNLRKLVENSTEQNILKMIKECKIKINNDIENSGNIKSKATISQINSKIANALNAKGLRNRGKPFTSQNILNLSKKHFKDILPKQNKIKTKKLIKKSIKKSIEKSKKGISSSTLAKKEIKKEVKKEVKVKSKESITISIQEKDKKKFQTSSYRITKNQLEIKEKRSHLHFTRRNVNLIY